MTDSWDRIVFAGLPDGGQVVRYDRASKWFVEWPPQLGRKRKPITVKQAAGIAEAFHRENGAFVRQNISGGQAFRVEYRKLESGLAHSSDPDGIRAVFRALVEPTT